MDINQIRELIEPFVRIFSALIVSGVSASVATQLLKLNWFPLAVSKFPRLTSAVLSVVASLVTIYLSAVDFVFKGPLDYVGFTIGTVLLAAWTYKVLLKGTAPSKESLGAQL